MYFHVIIKPAPFSALLKQYKNRLKGLETLARVQVPHKKQFDPNLDDPNLQIQHQMQLNSYINSIES